MSDSQIQRRIADEVVQGLSARFQMYGDEATREYANGILSGLMTFLVNVAGPQAAYETFQRVADTIAEADLLNRRA